MCDTIYKLYVSTIIMRSLENEATQSKVLFQTQQK
jgi:hypothetical protein